VVLLALYGNWFKSWLGVYTAMLTNLTEHFFQFSTASGYAKGRKNFMFLIWFATSWVPWKERINKIFRGEENTTLKLFENIKILSFWWHKAKFTAFPS